MKRTVVLLLTLCLLLSGCSSWFDGSYSSVVDHTEPSSQTEHSVVTVGSFYQLMRALENMVESGMENVVLTMEYQALELTEDDLDDAVMQVCRDNPFAAYAVEKIEYEMGTSAGQTAVSLHISYLPSRVDVRNIQRVQGMEQIEQLIHSQLDACSTGIVLYVESVGNIDYAQIVADYAATNPNRIMEMPEVTVNRYPDKALRRVDEIKFTYQTSRGSLRTMQTQVSLVFASAARYVENDQTPLEKINRLYTFLMNRYSSYEIQTSITPAYSLLLHGVGDGKAFAEVYGAMCREAGIDCQTVTGTRQGTPWIWNVVKIDGEYYHVDLLRCRNEGGLTVRKSTDMEGYVWDFSAYPIAS